MVANDEVELMLESRNSIPFYKFLGLTRDSFDAEKGCITLPWRDELMGNPRTKVLHGGVIAAIMDAEAGFLLITSCPEKAAGSLLPAISFVSVKGSPLWKPSCTTTNESLLHSAEPRSWWVDIPANIG